MEHPNGGIAVLAPSSAPAWRATATVLAADDLRKSYGSRVALRGLSFSLEAGRVLGFLGPNGAGKTTSIRILTTILEPDGGRFVVDGIGHEHPEEIRRRIGVLPESFGLPKHMTGVEYLTYAGQLYGRSARDAKGYGLALLEDLGLLHRARSLVGSYSHGMRQRLGIARALVNDPVVVFLDEPTLGLDPRGQQELLALVRRIAHDRHAGVILCSHLLAEVERVCDDVVILSSGEMVATGPVAGLIGHAGQHVVRIRVATPEMAHARRTLESTPGVGKVTATEALPGWLRVELGGTPPPDTAINNLLLDRLIRAGIPILSFDPDGGRLQELFLQLTARGTA